MTSDTDAQRSNRQRITQDKHPSLPEHNPPTEAWQLCPQPTY